MIIEYSGGTYIYAASKFQISEPIWGMHHPTSTNFFVNCHEQRWIGCFRIQPWECLPWIYQVQMAPRIPMFFQPLIWHSEELQTHTCKQWICDLTIQSENLNYFYQSISSTKKNNLFKEYKPRSDTAFSMLVCNNIAASFTTEGSTSSTNSSCT